MSTKVLNIRYLIDLCKQLRGLDNDQKDDFMRYNVRYYQLFMTIALSGGCLAAIMCLYSDYLLNGTIMPTLIPRLSLLVPLGIFLYINKKISNYKLSIALNHGMLHFVLLSTIWAVYYLQDKTYFAAGAVTIHIIMWTLGFSSRIKDTFISYILYFGFILLSDTFNHYDNMQIILALNIPCAFAVLFAQIILTLITFDHYLAIKKMEKETITDELTQVGNRVMLEDITDKANMKISNPSALIMLDIDHFKNVNDRHGHIVGDNVLKYLADYVRRSVRKNDYVIRYGGEEFLVILNNCTIEEGTKTINKIRKSVSTDTNSPVPITISAGIAEYTGDYTTALKLADEALYEAKNSGRNKVVVNA